ncbi:MAG: 50S ribosomal protein L25 [Candidatus Liptonbacteria bacterium]|nr:50S ribosomal protein L25 [Candidatus Liptonbacteria bacterium]
MDLVVETREKLGKISKSLRREGLIPAELYGHGVKNLHLAVSAREFLKVFKEAGENTIVNLLIHDEKKPVLIHEIKTNYISGEIDHVDFYEVRFDEKIKAKIQIEFTGEAPAQKSKGGVLNKAVSEIEVEALPGDLPHRFTLSLEGLDDLNKSFYVKDLKVSPKVRILADPQTVIVTVTEHLVEEEKIEAVPDVTAIKVEVEEKKAERSAEKTKKTE